MAIEKGDTVTLDFEGRLEDGTVFDSTDHKDHHHPMTFIAGVGQVIKGFDEAVMGMEKGDEKEVTIKSEDAYGPYREELKKEIPKDAIKTDKEMEKGMVLLVKSPEGHQIPVTIVDVSEKNIMVDLNHPLAGKNLIFKIKIVKYNKTSEEKADMKPESVETKKKKD
jgi:FKBP-type peptidyl-prolyl cis-trans isomerase 2